MVHLKRLLAPRFWKIPKKVKKWVVTPRPGPHKKFECIPLLILLRDILKLVDEAKDAKKIIKSGEVFVDGKPRKDHKYPVGLMDVVAIPKLKKLYRVVPTSYGLSPINIPKKESNLKLCRINGKTLLKKGCVQLNLHDGRNIQIPVKDPRNPKEDIYKTGDSILIEVPEQKILEHIRMEPENLAIITGGQNMGMIVRIKDVIKTRSREPNKVLCKGVDKEFDAIKDYVFVVGTKKPVITLEGKVV